MTPVTGKFDETLFRKYRALPSEPKAWAKWTPEQREEWMRQNRELFAKTEQRRALEGQLVLENGPLVKLLVAQYRGEDNTPPRRGFTKAKREPGVENLSWEEAYACGQTGLVKALRGLNLQKGGFTKYTAWKIRHELQSAITKGQVVAVPKGSDRADRPKGFDFFEDDDAMERALVAKRLADGADDEGGNTDADEEPKPRETPASVVVWFIEKRCEFGDIHVATMRDRLFGAYEYHAQIWGRSVATRQLETALNARDVWAENGTAPGGGRGRFFRGVRVISLREAQTRIEVSG